MSASIAPGTRPRRNSTSPPPMIIAAAAVCPLGLCTPVPPSTPAQAKNTTFSTAITPSTPTTATTQAAQPRHHPENASANATSPGQRQHDRLVGEVRQERHRLAAVMPPVMTVAHAVTRAAAPAA